MKLNFSNFFFALSVLADNSCQYKDDQGDLYDLSKLTNEKEDYKVLDPHTKTEIFFNICHGVVGDKTGLKNPEDSAGYYKDDSTTFTIGVPDKKIVKHDNHLVLSYKDGAACPNAGIRKGTTIIFSCDKSVSGNGEPKFVASPKDCEYIIYWATPLACPVSSSNNSGGSGGGSSGFSTFMIVISSLFFGYLILGILYNRFKKGAKGLDQLPHKKFWFDLYDFIKDMFIILFAKCGIKPKSSFNRYQSVSHHEQHVLINDDLEEI